MDAYRLQAAVTMLQKNLDTGEWEAIGMELGTVQSDDKAALVKKARALWVEFRKVMGES